MKLLTLFLAFGCIFAKNIENDKTSSFYTIGCSGKDQTGSCYIFESYMNDLRSTNFNDAIASVKQTGMWMYYEHNNYNQNGYGSTYWVHGIDIQLNFPDEYCCSTSSLRFGGNRNSWNEDSFTIYDHEFFAGVEFYYSSDRGTNLGQMSDRASSLILTGKSPWTFYTGYDGTGDSYCIYPNTDKDVGSNGRVLNFGLYPSLSSVGVRDNSFRSASKGCFGATVIRAAPALEAKEKFGNGAWGVFNVGNQAKLSSNN